VVFRRLAPWAVAALALAPPRADEAGRCDRRAGAPIAFEAVGDGVGDAERTETRRLVTSAADYRATFGHPPPASVDLAREWVVFYAAGARPTGGYEASVVSIARRCDGGLRVVTRLVSPGPACLVTQAITSPHALVRFARPADVDPRDVEFVAVAEERACTGP
jgi:hypothetical protein